MCYYTDTQQKIHWIWQPDQPKRGKSCPLSEYNFYACLDVHKWPLFTYIPKSKKRKTSQSGQRTKCDRFRFELFETHYLLLSNHSVIAGPISSQRIPHIFLICLSSVLWDPIARRMQKTPSKTIDVKKRSAAEILAWKMRFKAFSDVLSFMPLWTSFVSIGRIRKTVKVKNGGETISKRESDRINALNCPANVIPFNKWTQVGVKLLRDHSQ